jgi:CxxC-x17-CxxC domain-containing protein
MAESDEKKCIDLKCPDCEKEIPELPFPIYCKECWLKRKATGQNRLFKGTWKCAECGAEITELPFEPTQGRPVYCNACWAKRKIQ